jgi:hypothetical protein
MKVRAAALYEALHKLPDPETWHDPVYMVAVPTYPLPPIGLGKDYVMQQDALEITRLVFHKEAISRGRKSHVEWVLNVTQ